MPRVRDIVRTIYPPLAQARQRTCAKPSSHDVARNTPRGRCRLRLPRQSTHSDLRCNLGYLAARLGSHCRTQTCRGNWDCEFGRHAGFPDTCSKWNRKPVTLNWTTARVVRAKAAGYDAENLAPIPSSTGLRHEADASWHP